VKGEWGAAELSIVWAASVAGVNVDGKLGEFLEAGKSEDQGGVNDPLVAAGAKEKGEVDGDHEFTWR
jgi:hypothetical protein